jgi:hypothetical protein
LPAVGGRNFTNGDSAIGIGLVVALIAVFLPWFSYSFNCGGIAGCGIGGSFSFGALSYWSGWFFFLALLVGLVLFVLRTFVPTVTIPQLPQTDAMIYMIIGIFMALMAIIWLLLFSSASYSGPGYSAGSGFGLYVGLIAAIAVAAGGFLKRSEPQAAVSAYGGTSGNSYGGGSSPPPPPPL